MASFTCLPPELRVTIYHHLLQDGLTSGKRVVYCRDEDRSQQQDVMDISTTSKSPEAEDCVTPKSIFSGWHRSTMWYKAEDPEYITSLYDSGHAVGPDALKRAVHHAQIDDLLALASTSSQIRLEVLPIAWSNANITVYTINHRFKHEIFHIFGSCLSSTACSMIRELHIDISSVNYAVTSAGPTAKLITDKLPHLVFLTISLACVNTWDPKKDIDDDLKVFTFLPLDIFVDSRVYISP